MIVKYLPYERIDCLQTGLFRITQPKYLNDPTGEAQFAPFYNCFSDADYEYAIKKYLKSWLYNGSEPDRKFLEDNFLLPCGIRYTIEKFPSIAGSDKYKTTEEYDRYIANTLIDTINDNLMDLMNQTIGIISFTDSLTNNDMWLKYGEHGKGLAIEFDEDYFCSNYALKNVTYSNEARASITYYEGIIYINGIKLRNNYSSPLELQQYLLNSLDLKDLADRLFFTKNKRWSEEFEKRIIFDIQNYDDFKTPDIYLKKIPFAAFKSVTFGWDFDESTIEKVKKNITENFQLNHLKVQKVRYGKLEKYDELKVYEI